jgi:hypothetical protein
MGSEGSITGSLTMVGLVSVTVVIVITPQVGSWQSVNLKPVYPVGDILSNREIKVACQRHSEETKWLKNLSMALKKEPSPCEVGTEILRSPAAQKDKNNHPS